MRALIDEITLGTKPLDALTRLLDSADLPRGESLQVENKVRWELERPHCEVQLEPRGSYVIVLAELATLRLPRCCAICMKPAVTLETPQYEIMNELIVLEVPTCTAHAGKGKKAVSVRSWRPVIGQVGLEVKNAEYAQLIETVNG
jgi:hypothetical protein